MQKFATIIGFLAILCSTAFILKEHPDLGKSIYSPDLIHVKITGPVKAPGIYEIESGATGRDLVEKAGGVLPNVSISLEESSLEQLLVDGQAIDLGKR